MRTVLTMLLFCGFALARADAHAQQMQADTVTTTAPGLPLCPMPVHGADSAQTSAVRMPVYREPPGVHHFIRVVPARCHNPLAPAARSSLYGSLLRADSAARAPWPQGIDSLWNRRRR